MSEIGFGIDIGGSGIKGAPVDLSTGELLAERVRISTPQPSTPVAVAETVAQLVNQFGADAATLPIGITMPCVVSNGITRSAANIDHEWINHPAAETFAAALRKEVTLVNDADAAGIAETYYGAAQGQLGLVILTTLGTGIGSAMIYDGVLIPNSELGHLEIGGRQAEKRAAASVRTKKNLSWKAYTRRLQRYYSTLEFLFSPDLFVVGGGISRDSEKYLPYLELNTPIIPAQLRNQAGIVGAAWYAFHLQGSARTQS
ncbi:MAG: ROK family protein [Propionibacteriaceae bacterium]|jgi:polyphosphate glucokinase|nr:ROK family protein [Propionibacteriaceae bacterium]